MATSFPGSLFFPSLGEVKRNDPENEIVRALDWETSELHEKARLFCDVLVNVSAA